ncbi:MAG: DUF2236 domain-containing protein [Deltaproteobacteria bacterium]|nr:MAG: DUF2236 domain-containing protein [Deltaproteobacteria bacterium]
MNETDKGQTLSERIPGEFRYWEQRNSRYATWLRRGIRWVFGEDPCLPDAAVVKYAHSYYDADPVAEAFVEDVYLKHGQKKGRAMLDLALRAGVDAVPNAPSSMKTLFAEVEQIPDWVDWEQVELGARVFRRFGTHMYSFAGAITLEGYLENSVAKPLAFTGAYNGESAQRRFLETAGFWVDVSEPGNLLHGRKGVETCMRVRVMHVFVRKRLLRHPEWDLEGWGVPISQGDALLTLMGGSLIPGFGLRTLGYRTTRDEILAMMHFWRYVGHLLGVQPRWYPSTIQEALGLMYTSQIKSVHRSGRDGEELARSYLESYAPGEDDVGWDALVKHWEYRLQLGYVRLFLPPNTHKRYNLPGAGIWRLHPLLQFPFVFAWETARRNSATLDELHDKWVRRSTQAWVQRRLGKRSPEYKSVTQFTR